MTYKKFLDGAKTSEPPEISTADNDWPRTLQECIERLRSGADWFLRIYKRFPDMDWPEHIQDKWAVFFERWLALEEMARLAFGWEGCPLDPDRCTGNGPFLCLACAERLQKQARLVDAPSLPQH